MTLRLFAGTPCLPGNGRVVLEVDRAQHYAVANGQAKPTLYAKTVEADREFKLDGYGVYRFGAAELASELGRSKVDDRFVRLFKTYGVSTGR